MSEHTHAQAEHPAPARWRVGAPSLILGVAAGPAAWIAQLVLGYGLSGYACFRGDAPFRQTPPPGWSDEPALLMTINLVCLLLALAGAAMSFSHWRRTRGEKPGGGEHALEVGEGRTRFLAACGVLMSLGFAVAVAFDTTAILSVPTCWSIVP
jgi:hypothetical protein